MKDFRQRRPDGSGGWTWNLEGVTLVLYRLPELRAAVKAGQMIVVVEGEKDADAGAAIGLATTTSPLGAGKWRDEYAAEFVGANVVIIADKDKPNPKTGKFAGADHARRVAESIDLTAREIRVVELSGPEVKDLSDWLAVNPGTANEQVAALNRIVGETSEWKSPTSARLLTSTERAARYWDILDGRQRGDPEYVGWSTGIGYLDKVAAYFPGDAWIVMAATAVGKSSFLLTLQASLDNHAVPSLMATLEQPWDQLMDRQIAAMTAVGGPDDYERIKIDAWKLKHGTLDTAEWRAVSLALGDYTKRPSIVIDEPSLTTERLETYLKFAKVKYGIKVVFVDYMQRMTDRDGDSEYLRVSKISNALTRMARELRLCIVSAAQVNRRGAIGKDGNPPDLSEIRDSGQVEQDAAVVLALGRKEGGTQTLLAIRKNRHGPAGKVIRLMFEPEHVRFVEIAED